MARSTSAIDHRLQVQISGRSGSAKRQRVRKRSAPGEIRVGWRGEGEAAAPAPASSDSGVSDVWSWSLRCLGSKQVAEGRQVLTVGATELEVAVSVEQIARRQEGRCELQDLLRLGPRHAMGSGGLHQDWM